jgi:methionyl-tRNA formyltransferase
VRVLFWGTPEFATPSLRALLGEGFDVVGVVTQPDKPVGRSRSTLEPPPVKRVALDEGLPVLQPEKPRGEEFVAAVRALEPDLSVVVAYGHIIRRELIDLPPRGTINVHASLLPELRGAAPIQAAIRDGIDYTGVSIMRVTERMDAGPVILQLGTTVNADETYGELSLRLAEIGAAALIEALALIELGKAAEVPQMESQATYAKKIDRDSARVDWTRDAAGVSRAIRAYDPRPGAFTSLGGVDVKLYGARILDGSPAGQPGEILSAGADGLVVACGEGAVRLLQVQPAGKKRMAPDEWLRGRGAAVGQRFD